MNYSGQERRRHPRVNTRFIVSYRIYDDKNLDISQTKNLSLGGMLLTTNRAFAPGVTLALTIRIPFDPDPISIIAKVQESREVVKGTIYDTRLSFISVDEKHKKPLIDTLDYYIKKRT